MSNEGLRGMPPYFGDEEIKPEERNHSLMSSTGGPRIGKTPGSQVKCFLVQSPTDPIHRKYNSTVILEVTGEGIHPILPFQIGICKL